MLALVLLNTSILQCKEIVTEYLLICEWQNSTCEESVCSDAKLSSQAETNIWNVSIKMEYIIQLGELKICFKKNQEIMREYLMAVDVLKCINITP